MSLDKAIESGKEHRKQYRAVRCSILDADVTEAALGAGTTVCTGLKKECM